MTNNELWQTVLNEVELSISKANFTTWFKNTHIISQKDNKIIVNKFDEDTKVQANLLSIVFAHFFEEMKLREESAELPELPELPGIHLN